MAPPGGAAKVVAMVDLPSKRGGTAATASTAADKMVVSEKRKHKQNIAASFYPGVATGSTIGTSAAGFKEQPVRYPVTGLRPGSATMDPQAQDEKLVALLHSVGFTTVVSSASAPVPVSDAVPSYKVTFQTSASYVVDVRLDSQLQHSSVREKPLT
jgi:hypothetical protein